MRKDRYTLAEVAKMRHVFECFVNVAVRNRACKFLKLFGVCRAEHFEHALVRYVPRTITYTHIRNWQRVTYATRTRLSNEIHRFALVFYTDIVKDKPNAFCNHRTRHESEIEA